MIESINYATPNIRSCNFQSASVRGNHLKAPGPSSLPTTISPEENNTDIGMTPQATTAQHKKDFKGHHDVAIQFSIHEETGKTMIKIVDKETNKVIREIPSEEDLERSAQLRMYIGQLFDKIA